MKRTSLAPGAPCAGFTLVQLLVVIGLIGFLISIMIPSLCKSRESANRVKCQSNLSQLGRALLLYANENKGAFPQTHYVVDAPINLTNDGFDDANPFAIAPEGRKINNIPSAMFLLVRTQDLTTEVFTCPSGTAQKDVMANLAATQRGNFTGTGKPGGEVTDHVSYGFVNVYPSTAALEKQYKARLSAYGGEFAVAADLSPLPIGHADLLACKVNAPRSTIVKANSRNHDSDGQNVLYADGHAEFQQSPLCGADSDNIFAAQDTAPAVAKTGASVGGADPKSATDSVILINQK